MRDGEYRVRHVWTGTRMLGPHVAVVERGRWAALEAIDAARASDDGVLVAGLIDGHGHVGLGPYAIDEPGGVEPEVHVLCSQGDAGPHNYDTWRDAVSALPFRAVMALNLAPEGERLTGCFDGFSRATADRATVVAERDRERIRLLAVNLSARSLGTTVGAETVLSAALDAAERAGLHLLLALAPEHLMPIDAQLERLRPGDIVTYCYRSQPWCLFPEAGPRPSLANAVARGVLLDVAHGSEAFDPAVARRAVAAGFAPAIISSGRKQPEPGHRPTLALAAVGQRMVQAGMAVGDVLAAMTATPAQVLGVPAPTVAIGAPARGAVLALA